MVLSYVKSGEPAVVSLSSRDFLARRINSRLTPKEREELYMKWDVSLEGKQRKLHFVNKLWTDPYDSRHVQESAEIVAKLVGFCESGNISKRCLSSTSPCLQIKSGTMFGTTSIIFFIYEDSFFFL
ncbi:unnamed protein product [Brassica napus]|uniref:(rape) hypothetical protein n=1 Tax=Brassica napus TaxID=3708 RepID=A0A816K0Y7_BRANA|nr:unnamed protein product [Brassica napus]